MWSSVAIGYCVVAVGQGSVAGEGERSAGEYHMETGQARERDPTASDVEYARGEWAGSH